MARSRNDSATGPVHDAQDVRGGEIILKTRRRRFIFLGGLVAFGLFALIAAIVAPH